MNTLVRSLFLALLAVGTLATAGDLSPAPGQDSSTPRGSASAQKASDTPVAEPTPTPKASPPPLPTPTADAEEQLEEFVPSEEIRADQAVAFPVDI